MVGRADHLEGVMAASLQDLMQHKDYKVMSKAATACMREMSDAQILAFFDAAGTKALYSGDGIAANAIRAILNGPDAYGEHLRAVASSLISDRPDFLKHFTADFTRAIETRLN